MWEVEPKAYSGCCNSILIAPFSSSIIRSQVSSKGQWLGTELSLVISSQTDCGRRELTGEMIIDRGRNAEFLSPPLPNVFIRRYIGITLSVCPSFRLSFCPCVRFCPGDFSWTVQWFSTKLCSVVFNQTLYEAVCYAEKLVHYLQCQHHNGAYIFKI